MKISVDVLVNYYKLLFFFKIYNCFSLGKNALFTVRELIRL